MCPRPPPPLFNVPDPALPVVPVAMPPVPDVLLDVPAFFPDVVPVVVPVDNENVQFVPSSPSKWPLYFSNCLFVFIGVVILFCILYNLFRFL